MAPVKKRRAKKKRSLIDTIPEMLVSALANHDDFILTYDTDPDTGAGNIYAMTGKFVSSCMLRKLMGLVESQQDEGGIIVTRAWPPGSGEKKGRKP